MANLIKSEAKCKISRNEKKGTGDDGLDNLLSIYMYMYMVHAAIRPDYYSADWLRLKKRKSRKNERIVEVKKMRYG